MAVLSLDYKTIPKLHSSVKFFNHELSRNNEQFLGHCKDSNEKNTTFSYDWKVANVDEKQLRLSIIGILPHIFKVTYYSLVLPHIIVPEIV